MPEMVRADWSLSLRMPVSFLYCSVVAKTKLIFFEAGVGLVSAYLKDAED